MGKKIDTNSQDSKHSQDEKILTCEEAVEEIAIVIKDFIQNVQDGKSYYKEARKKITGVIKQAITKARESAREEMKKEMLEITSKKTVQDFKEKILQEFDEQFNNTPSVNLDIQTYSTKTGEMSVYRDRLKDFISQAIDEAYEKGREDTFGDATNILLDKIKK